MTPGARSRERAGRERRHRKPGQNSEVEEMMATLQRRPCRSALKACGWKGTTQAQENRRKTDPDLPGASRRRDTPRAHPQDLTESRGGREARRRSQASVVCTCPLLHCGEKCLPGSPAPGGCIPAPRNPRRMSMIATREGAGGGKLREDPVPPDQEGLMNGAAGIGAERRAQGTESHLAPAGPFPRG